MPKLKAYEQLAAWGKLYPAPCQAACPVHTDARAYVTLTAKGRFEQAFRAASAPNPVPSICGRACSAPCEDVCTRQEFDRPVRIRQLKRFLTDRFVTHPDSGRLVPPTGLGVGVVGAGPAGLAAAQVLALHGHAVTVYEAAPEPGGTAMLGVPRFRLAQGAIARDVAAIEELGVTIKTGVRVGGDVTLEGLRREHDAVFIAAGAMRPNDLDVLNVHLPGVVQALPFLEEANLGGTPECGRHVAVIGGGYTAMDAARTALRLGAGSVTVLYRRTRSESEVHDEELEETLHEGVRIEYLVSPMRIVAGADGRAAGMEFVRNRLGDKDSSGRARPVPIPGSEFVFETDMVILALGQAPDPQGVDPELGAKLRETGEAMMTVVPGIFAGGDFLRGASTIIEAVADGKAAAEAIHRYLREVHAPGAAWPEIDASEQRTIESAPSIDGRRGRGPRPDLGLDDEVELPMTRAAAMAEGLRCLHCGLVPEVIFDKCTACQACALICPADCIPRVAIDAEGNVHEVQGIGDVLVYQIESDKCIRCGRCFGACPTGAIVVEGFSWR